MTKAMDLLMWNLEVSDRDKVLPVIFELAEKVQSEHGIRVRPMRRWQLRKDLDAFAEVYNSAWSQNWDFVPFSKKDLDAYRPGAAAGLRQALVHDRRERRHRRGGGHGDHRPRPQPGARADERPPAAARLVALPAPRAAGSDRVRVGFLGVKPEYQHTGVAAKLYVEHFNAAAARPQTGGEMGWILETNTAMNRGMEAMGGRVVKRYRVYERMLEGGAPADAAAGAGERAPRRRDLR